MHKHKQLQKKTFTTKNTIIKKLQNLLEFQQFYQLHKLQELLNQY